MPVRVRLGFALFAATAIACLTLGCPDKATGPASATGDGGPAHTLRAVTAGGPAATTDDEDVAEPAYVLKGDLVDMQAKKTIRFLVPGSQDYLPRNEDPRAAEEELARAFASKLGLHAVMVPTARDQLIAELNAGAGDVIVASLAVTPERTQQVAFSRPIRFVQQVVVTKDADTSVGKLADLSGKEVVVRASSSYASTLKALQGKIKDLKVKFAPETSDTFDLLHQVARGEAKITIADSDILTAAQGFETGLKAAFNLTAKDPIAWGMRKEGSSSLKAALDAFLVEMAMTSHRNDTYKADLDEIQKQKVLRVLTRNSSTTFFLYRGEQLGFEYEFAREFAKSLGVRLEVIVPPTREALAEWVKEGKGDMVAAGLTITPEREKDFAFSTPYQMVNELLVVSAKDTATQGLGDLKGKKISVRKSSSYYQTLAGLKDKYGFEIEAMPEDMETEDILAQVGEGKIAATVADSNIYEIELTYNGDVRSVGPVGDGELKKVAWMMRPDQPKLKAAADAFVKKMYKGIFYNVTLNKYYKNPKTMRDAQKEERSDKAGQLSPYDALSRKWAKQYELDWRLVTSQMYQESRFDPHAKSWVGAQGLMQVMPRTAKELKIEDVVDPDKGIQAGVMLLSRYAKMFDGNLKEKDRIRFAIASYNCGPGHVHDARRLARDQGLNPDKWFGNVEQTMMLLSQPQYAKTARHGYCRCGEPVKYVSEIQTRYDAYSRLVQLE